MKTRIQDIELNEFLTIMMRNISNSSGFLATEDDQCDYMRAMKSTCAGSCSIE